MATTTRKIDVGVTFLGNTPKIGDFVKLKDGTIIGNNVQLADYVKTTGLCYIGNNVNIRTDACISKGVIIEDWAFIGPGVMTNHTKHVTHGRSWVKDEQLVTRIGYGSVIGSKVSMIAGVTIGDNVILGANTCVYKDILESGIYVGNPAKKIAEVPLGMTLTPPTNYKPYRFKEEDIEKYMPKLRL